MKALILKLIQKLFLKTPPIKIPKEFMNDFSMDWRIDIKDMYINEIKPNFLPRIYTNNDLRNNFKRIKNKQWWNYIETDFLIYDALEKYTIKDKSIAIMGSQTPWYESIWLYYWWCPTTIEYGKIISFIKWLRTIKYLDFKKKPIVFDMAFSISSFEHDWLWRYWDPINPNWDFEAMREMKKIVKKWWLLFLAIPIWKDCVVWNAHRVYGKIRLPLLLKGWEIIDTYWFSQNMLDVENIQSKYQPLFILRNT